MIDKNQNFSTIKVFLFMEWRRPPRCRVDGGHNGGIIMPIMKTC